jgi:hypothetical protein
MILAKKEYALYTDPEIREWAQEAVDELKSRLAGATDCSIGKTQNTRATPASSEACHTEAWYPSKSAAST